MVKTITLAALLTTTAIVAPASADRPRVRRIVPTTFTTQTIMRVQRREARHLAEIHAGLMDGGLTMPEAKRLYDQQGRIERTLARYARDGRIRAHEARRLDRLQDRASADIRKLRRNRAVRPGLPAAVHQPVRRAPAPRRLAAPPAGPRPVSPHPPARRKVAPKNRLVPAGI